MNRIKTAAILAAGLGSRLKHLTKEKPKGFIEIEGVSLIERSVLKLKQAGIQDVFIGTGYFSEIFDELAQKNELHCIRNELYASSGSMYTLYNMRNDIREDFLLLEADLLYESAALDFLLDHPYPNLVLASGKTHSGDEVYIDTIRTDYLLKMSKKKDELENIYGELVGINKISISAFGLMCDFAEEYFANNLMLDYEYTMVAVTGQAEFRVLRIDDLAWCEIDDENHLHRAIHQVYPLIESRDNSRK